MIQPKQLRIGNWVGHDASWSVVNEKEGIVFQWQDYHFAHVTEATMSYDSLLPIPLTPEILEKCGFVKNTWGQHEIELNGFSTIKKKLFFSGDYLYLEECDRQRNKDLVTIWNRDIMKVFHLHQLQNLYFALTGTELNYKP